jgi:cardiolipin synthase
MNRGGGASGRAAAGAVRIANVVGAAFTNRRVIEPVEARITVTAGALLLSLGVLFAAFPRIVAYPLVLLFVWIACGLFYHGWKLRRLKAMQKARADVASPDGT